MRKSLLFFFNHQKLLNIELTSFNNLKIPYENKIVSQTKIGEKNKQENT